MKRRFDTYISHIIITTLQKAMAKTSGKSSDGGGGGGGRKNRSGRKQAGKAKAGEVSGIVVIRETAWQKTVKIGTQTLLLHGNAL